LRRLLALLAAGVLLAAVPVTATAAPPTRFSDHTVGFFCEGISPTNGTGFAFIGATVSDEFGPDAFVDYWASDGPSGPPDVSRDFDQPVSLTYVNGELTGSFAVVDENGDPAGTATIDAVLAPAGDPVPISDSFRFGNRQERFSGVSQPMTISGTFSVSGLTFDLSQCFADETSLTYFSTNPTAFAARFADRSVFCELSNTAGDTGFLFVGLDADLAFVEAGLESADGSVGYFASGELILSGGSGSGALDLYDPMTIEPVDGEAQLSISITATERFRYLEQNATFRRITSGDLLDIEGSLTFPGGYAFDLGGCVGQDATIKSINTFPKGPKPGGKVPSNDLPSGATALAVGSRTTINTKGASPDAEVVFPCSVLFDFETGEFVVVPVGNTVWYTVTGTGDPVTIDTAGSDYDTVVAVYTESGGVYDPVACVDDVLLDPIGRSLQASVTFDTVAGETYYVQIGGFPESFTYGTLRVAVR
jgi:hypothetical protein